MELVRSEIGLEVQTPVFVMSVSFVLAGKVFFFATSNVTLSAPSEEFSAFSRVRDYSRNYVSYPCGEIYYR